MKFRIRGDAFTKQVVTEFESDAVLVLELKIRIQQILQTNDEEFFGSMQLSMNGKEAILTEDTELLSNLGFRSGDTIYILGISSGAKTAKLQKLSSNSSLEKEQKILNQGSNSLCQHQEASLCATIEEKQNEKANIGNFEDMCSNRAFTQCVDNKHHIPLSETPDFLIPESFTRLVVTNSPNILFESTLEKLAGVLHLLMVETGFEPQTNISCSDSFCTLPNSWKLTNGTLRLNYKTRSQSPSTIVLSSMGSLVIVYGIGSVGKSMSLKLKPNDFSLPPVGSKQLRQLSIDFKNEIAFPLYVHTEREANGECPAHFSNLPPEILSNVLQRLDAKSLSRIAITSCLFQQLASQPSLWKKLVIRDFGKKLSTRPVPDTLYWKQFYKDEYILEKKQQGTLRTIRGMLPQVPHPLVLGPRVYPDMGHDFPGIVGGYSDLYPNLRGFGPTPPRRRQPFQNDPRFPPGPFDRYGWSGFPPI